MVTKITKWILFLLLGVCSACSHAPGRHVHDQVALKPPVNFKTYKQSSFPLYDNLFAKAYLQVGSRNPKWDADVVTALKLWSYQQCDEGCVVAGPEFYTMIDALRRAVTNGCDDPLVLYLAVRLDEVKNTFHTSTPDLLPQNSHASYARIMEGLKNHPYPAIVQIKIHIEGALDAMSYSAGDSIPPLVQNRSNWVDHAVSLAGEVDFEQTAPEQYRDVMERLINTLWIGGDNKTNKTQFDRLEAVLKTNKTCSKPILLSLEGAFYHEWAWTARGVGYADTVTEEGRRLFRERLEVAQRYFEQAWALNSSNEYICKQLVQISGAQCDMDALEKWFQRGKKLNPDDEMLYIAKLNYLQPRWGGSVDDLLQLGRECLKEGRWDSQIPFVLLEAHDMSAGDTLDEKRAYFAQPDVWKEIEPLFKTYLARYPMDYSKRTSYANYAAWAGKWDLVAQLVRELGRDEMTSAWRDPSLTPRLIKIKNSMLTSTNPSK